MADAIGEWERRLEDLAPEQWPAFVTAHSGLPGPRANLSLATAAARRAGPAAVEALLASDDEFAVMCAAAALARHADDGASEQRARMLASDDRWRVREGVAIGLQLWGDGDPLALARLVSNWADDPDPLVRRAAIAAICEPRLLRTPDAAAVAVDACERATRGLLALPEAERRRAPARTLRQALGYCWSVAVAADPTRGLPAFHALDATDPDIAWIVRENLRKKRLSSLV